MPILWMLLDDQTRILLREFQLENYGLKLDYPGDGKDITVEPAIEDTSEVEVLMKQTRKSWKDA